MAIQGSRPTPLEASLSCPVCGQRADRYVEVIASQRQLRLSPEGTVEIEGYYETEGWDEGSLGESLCCPKGHVWPLPSSVSEKIEFVMDFNRSNVRR